jgi:hypothetical protein
MVIYPGSLFEKLLKQWRVYSIEIRSVGQSGFADLVGI